MSAPAPTSRSPSPVQASPVQAPPVQQTPGPRAAALQKLYSDAISHTLRTCSYSNFASSFPTPASHAPDAMKRLHSDFVEKLHRSCKLNFDQILRDRQVVASLNDLDRLVDDARRRKAAAEQATNRQPVQPPLPYVSVRCHCTRQLLTRLPALIPCQLRRCIFRISRRFCLTSTLLCRQDCKLLSSRTPTWSTPSRNNDEKSSA